MIVNEERKTSPKQRIIIAAIAAFMLFSTFALYVGIVLNYQNQEASTSDINRRISRWSVLREEYQKKKDAQGDELSKKYFDQFKKYRQNVKAFNAAGATSLVKKDLVVGKGRLLEYKTSEDGKSYESMDTNYAAYYIGWLSDETIFDSSFDNNDNPTKLKSPLKGSTGMIQGWLEGLEGMRIGGSREITVPSVLGYGSNGQGDIPANAPLKFVIMLTEKPDPIEVSDELEELNMEFQQQSLRALEQ
jgi:FKBP-type peptidyl-prolyl cis-trans isomerase FkpA